MVRFKLHDKSDQKLAADAAKVGFVAYATAIGSNPLLGVAAELAHALYGAVIDRRRARANQLVENLVDSQNLTDEILNSEAFQDGFVYSLEKYIRERNADKRLIMSRIFLGFIDAGCDADYPLEEMNDLVSRLRFSDIELLRLVCTKAREQSEYPHPRNTKSFQLTASPDRVSRLIYFGLLTEDRQKNGPRILDAGDPGYLHVWLSPLGKQFSEYIRTQ